MLSFARTLSVGVCISAAVGLAPAAHAVTPVTVTFSGYLYHVTDSVSSEFAVGDAVSGAFTYDPKTEASPWNSEFRMYSSGVSSGFLNVGAYNVTFSPSARMFVSNDEGDRRLDRFIVDDFNSIASDVNGLPFYGIFFNWQDNAGAASNGFKLPSRQKDFDAYGTPTGAIDWVAGDAQNRVTFLFDSVSVSAAVPEPSTWAMMLVGFGAIGFAMRRKQRQTVRYNFA